MLHGVSKKRLTSRRTRARSLSSKRPWTASSRKYCPRCHRTNFVIVFVLFLRSSSSSLPTLSWLSHVLHCYQECSGEALEPATGRKRKTPDSPAPAAAAKPLLRRRWYCPPVLPTPSPAGQIAPRAANLTIIKRHPVTQMRRAAHRVSSTRLKANPAATRTSPRVAGAQGGSATPQLTIKACFQKQLSASSSRLSNDEDVPCPPRPLASSERTLEPTCTPTSIGGLHDAMAQMASYAADIAKQVLSGRRDLRGCPWVLPDDCQVKAPSALQAISDAALLPRVFIWAPEKLQPGWRLQCPTCMRPTSYSECHAPRIVHTLTNHYMYVCTKHLCYQCPGAARGPKPVHRQRLKLSADQPKVLARMPVGLKQSWNIVSIGQTLFDVEVLDHVRAMATRTSWSALADGINEMNTMSWVRSVRCTQSTLRSPAVSEPGEVFTHLPAHFRVRDKWLRSLYMLDAAQREGAVSQELEAELGNDILLMDWTCDAAAKCGSPYLFNAMSGDLKVLVSKLTRSNGPREVEPELLRLKQRGVVPRVVYVDDHCCSTWKELLEPLWPHVCVRLDGTHAIRRLAQTTTSTQHPWHGLFCKSLASAIYTHDPAEQNRLRQAWARAGHGATVPEHVQKQYVPRVIVNPLRIIAALQATFSDYANKRHAVAGELLTAATHSAWASLRRHVAAGCLCDPPNIELNRYGRVVSIGGENFSMVTSSRGSSPLEGFHAHQKRWLGHMATHAVEAGEALLRDGALRWNKNRGCDAILREGRKSETL